MVKNIYELVDLIKERLSTIEMDENNNKDKN